MLPKVTKNGTVLSRAVIYFVGKRVPLGGLVLLLVEKEVVL